MILDPERRRASRPRSMPRSSRPGRRSSVCRRVLHLFGRGVSARCLHPRPRNAAALACVHRAFRPPHLRRSAARRYSCRRAGLSAAGAAVGHPEARSALAATGRRLRSSSCAGSIARGVARSSMCRWPSITSASFRPRMRRDSSPRSNGKPPSMRRSDRSPPERRRPRSLGSRQAAATFLLRISRRESPWTRRSNGSTSFERQSLRRRTDLAARKTPPRLEIPAVLH